MSLRWVRGRINRINPRGFGYVRDDEGDECFLYVKDFRRAKRAPGSTGEWAGGTELKFLKIPARPPEKPSPRAVKITVLS